MRKVSIARRPLNRANRVDCEQTGFQPVESPAVVEAGSSTTVNFALSPGTVSQEVKVTAAATAEMNYESHAVARRDRGAEHSKPAAERPQLRSVGQPAAWRSGCRASARRPQRSDRHRVFRRRGAVPPGHGDGLQINDFNDGNAGAGTAINFSNEVIQEFQSANFDLSTATTLQGAVNMVTRSGGNNLHGSAYFFYRDHNMAAYPGLHLSPFNPNPYFVRKNPGFDLSGPIVKDKLFFFGNYEYTGQTAAVTVQPDLASIAPGTAIFSSPNTYNYTTTGTISPPIRQAPLLPLDAGPEPWSGRGHCRFPVQLGLQLQLVGAVCAGGDAHAECKYCE